MADENKFGELKSTLIKAKTSAPEDAAKVDNKRDSKGRAYATGRRKESGEFSGGGRNGFVRRQSGYGIEACFACTWRIRN